MRLLIARFFNGRITDIYAGRKITRLGSMVDQTGMLQPDTMTSSLKALREFSSLIRRHGAGYVRAVGTSALREARNADIFLTRVKEETGIAVEVISGEEEARLTLKGVLHAFLPAETATTRSTPYSRFERRANHLLQGPFLIMDIGGGSTEWIYCEAEDRNSIMGSLPSGVIKLARKCITSDPVSAQDIEKLNGEIESVLDDLKKAIVHLNRKPAQFVGTGGTFTTLASVDLGLISYSREKIHLHRIPISRLIPMRNIFLLRSLRERKNIQGLEAERADLIIPGVQFTMKMMELFRFRELIISDYGLIEGALLEMREAIEESLPEAGKP